MCAIVGVASNAPQTERAWLASARDSMSHRGPDDAGLWWSGDGRVGLAHRRLAIVDLSPLGHQPMHLQAQGLSIVFNGEIYNFGDLRKELQERGHQFKSHSDTEVLLFAYLEWGTECLARLNGMFAFALLDQRRGQMFLARDRAGEKPIFIRKEGKTLYFASELKALLSNPSLPRKIDSNALDCYLGFGFVPGDRCILEGYRKLPAAHAMTFDLTDGHENVWRYWHLPSAPVESETFDADAAVEELGALLEDAVSRQLMADVPVGVLLSGGLDSSLITAFAARRSSQLRTFTVGFPGHARLDETEHARTIARHFGTQHTELEAAPTTADMLPELAKQFDEPIVDSSMFPTWLVSKLVREHCTVALGGDGGDELFGGYTHYARMLWMRERLAPLPYALRGTIAKISGAVMPVGMKGRNYLQGLGVDFDKRVPRIATYFDAGTRRRLLGGAAPHAPLAEAIFDARTPAEPDLLQRATRMDFNDYLAEDILVKVDRASMLNSLEVRAPLLDHRVIEFAFGKVPSALKATPFDKKILLKRLAAKFLPPEFDRNRKQGFSIPLADWLRHGRFRDLFWETLSASDCIFDHTTVRSLWRGQDRGRSNQERIFALVQFEIWRKTYGAHF